MTLTPTTPLTDAEIEVLRTCHGTIDEINRCADEHMSVGRVHFLRHRPSGGVALAMMRDSALMCSSTAVLHSAGGVVPIQECITRLSR